MIKYLMTLFLATVVSSCTSSQVETKAKRTEPVAYISSDIMKGHYIWGNEVNTFTPCGSKETFWVEGSAALLKELENEYKSLTEKPYEKTFATVSGKTREKDINSDGFDSDYDGLITIDSIMSMNKSSGADCN